jgi:hypothetical protein
MSEEKYNQNWFKERAFKSLRKIKDGVWDYSDSLLLYTSVGSEIYESLQEADTPYFGLVTKPEQNYLSSIAKDIATLLPDHFDYIDLGPGTEHKEQFLFDELKRQGKAFRYVPVDISEYFLNLAVVHASRQAVEVSALKASFEELPELLGQPIAPRFVSLGLTFSNYSPQEILALLKDIAGENGFAFINAQIRDRVDMPQLQSIYQDDAVHLADEKLQLIGLNPDTDASSRTVDDGFRVWCTILRSNEELKKLGINEGGKLMVFESLRYTKESLESELQGTNYSLFDTGESFIAGLIRN